jgi:hypothetical protein
MRARALAVTAAVVALVGYGALCAEAGTGQVSAPTPSAESVRITRSTVPPTPTVLPVCGTETPKVGVSLCRITDPKKIAEMMKKMQDTNRR